jgi:DNA/RNA endonuclease YhcR with UshA esterase domain
MKTKTFLVLFVCALAASAISAVTQAMPTPQGGPQATATYTAADAAKHVGEIATVTDRVDGVHQSGKGNIFLNMGGKYPNQAFTAWIPSASASQFSNPQQYEGKTVSVSGKITLYHGKPEIIVENVSQIIAK